MEFYIESTDKFQFKRINSLGVIREPSVWSIKNESIFNNTDSTNEFLYLNVGERLYLPVNNTEFLITTYNIHFDLLLSSEFNDVSIYHDSLSGLIYKQSYYNDTRVTRYIYGDDITSVVIENNCFDKIKVYFDSGLVNNYLKDYNISVNYSIDTSNDISSIKVDNNVKSNLLFNDYVYTSIRQDKSNIYYNTSIILKKLQYQQLKKMLDYSSNNNYLIKCKDTISGGYNEKFFGENYGSETTNVYYSLISFKITLITGIYYHCDLTLRKESYDQYI